MTQPIENIVEQLKVHSIPYFYYLLFKSVLLSRNKQTLDLENPRSANLTLRGLTLGPHDCESLEDVLKHVPLKLLDLGASHSSDDVTDSSYIDTTMTEIDIGAELQGLIALFDMIEFYEAASHVSFAAHKNMTTRGWQACCRMIKRVQIFLFKLVTDTNTIDMIIFILFIHRLNA